MGLLIGLFGRLVGDRLAPLAAYLSVLVLLVCAVLVLRWDAYRDGVRDTDDRWEQAGRRLEEQARRAAGAADAASVHRVEQDNARIAQEKEKLDEAEAAGTSPLDVLFGVRD